MADKPLVFVYDDRGYVWSTEDALKLRRDYHIVGFSIGGLSDYRCQNQICGLPLELSAEEVSLLVRKAWIRTVRYVPKRSHPDAPGDGPGPSGAAGSKRKAPEARSLGYEDYGQDDLGEGDIVDAWDDAYGYDPAPPPPKPAAPAPKPPGWTQFVKDNRRVDFPLTPPDLASLVQDLPWAYPQTPHAAARLAVFEDLFDLGYTLTDGVKFGGDFLAYPGDPSLYHAQFVIRVLGSDRPVLPCILAAHSRTSHGARKHFIIASVEDLGPAGGEEGSGTGGVEAAPVPMRKSEMAATGSEAFAREREGLRGAAAAAAAAAAVPVAPDTDDLDAERAAVVGVEPRSRGQRRREVLGRRWGIRYLTTSPDAGFGRDKDKD